VSGAGRAQRLGVFAVFFALAAAGFLPLLRGAPALEVRPAELESLERALLEGARSIPP